MVGKVIDFLIVNAIYIAPGILVAALILSESTRKAAALVLRLIARPLLLVAVIALVYDGTRTLAGGAGLVITSFGDHWESFFPAAFDTVHQMIVRRLSPVVWDAGLMRVLKLPAWVVFGLAGLLLAWIGRKRQRVNVYINS
jgi:hypothetical protein